MNKTPYNIIKELISPYKATILIAIICLIIANADTAASGYILKLIIERVATSNSDQNFWHVLIPIVSYIAITIITVLLFRIHDYQMYKVMPKLRSKITRNLFANCLEHSYSFYIENNSGKIANMINDSARVLSSLILSVVSIFIPQFFAILFSIIIMYFVHPLFSITLLIWVILFLYVNYVLAKKAGCLSIEQNIAKNQLTSRIGDVLNNIHIVNLFSNKPYELAGFDILKQNNQNKDNDVLLYNLKIRSFQAFSIVVLISVMLFILLFLHRTSYVTAGDFAMILAISLAIVSSIRFLSNEFLRFSMDYGNFKNLSEILCQAIEIKDATTPVTISNISGTICFKEVEFAHSGNKGNKLQIANLIINPNEKIGLVGLSGSGKSTFVNLILRFYDIDRGSITIDGTDIKNISQHDLRKNIAVIPQESLVFNRSIYDNILYGNLDATKDSVLNAADKTYINKYVQQYTDGIFTQVGERGIKLSGGQKQQISIARAILKNSKILILDEATSALDHETQHYIQHATKELMQNKTVIIIAHKLDTLKNLDRILVFDKGKIVEEGAHDQLLSLKGTYYKLWEMRKSGFLPD